MNDYINRFISILSNKYNHIPKEEITEIFYTNWIYENYCGFLFEDIIINELRKNKFTVFSNKYLDNNYKIDFLISNKYSNKAIAIQSKSFTYLNCGDEEKQKHINGLETFKNEDYKNFVLFDNPIKEVYTKYLLHNDLNINSCKGNILIDTDNIKDLIILDNNFKSIDSLIRELTVLLRN